MVEDRKIKEIEGIVIGRIPGAELQLVDKEKGIMTFLAKTFFGGEERSHVVKVYISTGSLFIDTTGTFPTDKSILSTATA